VWGGALFAPTVTALNKMNLPAGNFSSWFRVAPSLATLTSIASGDALCAAGPAAGTNLFPAGTAATVTVPTPPAIPTPVTTASTGTGVFCFAYSGPTTPVTSFATRFVGAVTAVNRWNLPDGNFNSWFAAAPSLSTITSLNNGDVVCVSAPIGTSVFSALVPVSVSISGVYPGVISKTGPTNVRVTGHMDAGSAGASFVLVLREYTDAACASLTSETPLMGGPVTPPSTDFNLGYSLGPLPSDVVSADFIVRMTIPDGRTITGVSTCVPTAP